MSDPATPPASPAEPDWKALFHQACAAPIASPETADLIESVETWVNKRGGDATVGEIVAMVADRLRALYATPPAPVATDEARDALSGLSSLLGAGMGDEKTTIDQYVSRIRWGIDHLIGAAYRRCADKVEELSKRPQTTWGEVRTALLSLSPGTPPAPAATDDEVARMVERLKHELGWGIGPAMLCQEAADLLARVAARLARAEETFTDENSTVWAPPTAWAYAQVCKANDKNRQRAEAAEKEISAITNEFEAYCNDVGNSSDSCQRDCIARARAHLAKHAGGNNG